MKLKFKKILLSISTSLIILSSIITIAACSNQVKSKTNFSKTTPTLEELTELKKREEA